MRVVSRDVMWEKYYKKDRRKRIEILRQLQLITDPQESALLADEMRLGGVADKLIENQIGTYEVPYGIIPQISVNGQNYTVPIATEEPSVIAAASFGAKTLGNFSAKMAEKLLIGQIVFSEYDLPQLATLSEVKMIEIANRAHPSILNYGSGVQSIKHEHKADYLVFYVTLDTGQAMGANIMNTILETLKAYLETQLQAKSLMAILSNYALKSVASAQFTLPVKALETTELTGKEVAERIVEAYRFATVDLYRATTNNKGVMNGITGVVLATGNDTRAVEAGAHAYATRSGQYQPLTKYWIVDNQLHGEINIPLQIGNVGASIGVHPMAQLSQQLIGHSDVKELAMIIASVGLAQNFSALRALVTVGIQKGHMRLHYKTLAIAAGAQDAELEPLLARLEQMEQVDFQTIQAELTNLRA